MRHWRLLYNKRWDEIRMHIIVVGVDHTTAPIALREQLACSPCEIPQVLEAARRTVQESVLLSTCNRLELYALCSEADEGRTALLRVLSEMRQVELAALQAHCYGKADGEAVGHLFEVACGLHSLVPGEPQATSKRCPTASPSAKL